VGRERIKRAGAVKKDISPMKIEAIINRKFSQQACFSCAYMLGFEKGA
jgi:hypothetical protein